MILKSGYLQYESLNKQWYKNNNVIDIIILQAHCNILHLAQIISIKINNYVSYADRRFPITIEVLNAFNTFQIPYTSQASWLFVTVSSRVRSV